MSTGTIQAIATMKAMVYKGPGQKSWDSVPRPGLTKPTDAIVRITKTTICGTDLHILKGDVPAVTDGRILGHEAVGTVESVGAGVKRVAVGDKVLVSCITACGSCRYCRDGSYGQCESCGNAIGKNRLMAFPRATLCLACKQREERR